LIHRLARQGDTMASTEPRWGFRRRPAVILAGALLLAGACAPTRPSVGDSESGAPFVAAPAVSTRTLNIAARVEPAYLTQKPIQYRGISLWTTVRMFNAYLAYKDDAEVPHAYLAQDLPQLNTDSWQVEPD